MELHIIYIHQEFNLLFVNYHKLKYILKYIK